MARKRRIYQHFSRQYDQENQSILFDEEIEDKGGK